MTAKEKLRDDVEDTNIWRKRSGFKQKFSTYETWSLMRTTMVSCEWSKSILFSHATPKYAFLAWLAIRDRLSTLDRVAK